MRARAKKPNAGAVRRSVRAGGTLCALPFALFALAVPGRSGAEQVGFGEVERLTAGLDFDDARAMLAGAAAVAPDDPRIALERARLAIYELDCDAAAVALGRPEVQAFDRDQVLTDIARGCQRVTASLVGQRDEARGIDVRWQDEADAPLGSVLMDTVVKARDALTRDLGVDWPRPTRIVVVRDLLSLAAMTGLPYESARTTGTVAVAKWGRVTLLSPRANRFGFPWRDTIAHELTHLAVTRATADRAPLWLQEGLAKREETRWRLPGPFDDRPTPDSVAQRGLTEGLGLPLDRLGPSIAMLPSADAAMVAFAEVTSFVRFYVDSAGPRALPALFASLRDGKDTNAALVDASGANLKAWDARWRAMLEAHAGAHGAVGGGDDRRTMSPAVGRELRERTRLAELLLRRDHAAAAVAELDRISDEARHLTAADPALRALRGAALEGSGRAGDAEALAGDVAAVSSSWGPWWVLRGRLASERGDVARADESFSEALSVTPLDPGVACMSNDPTTEPDRRAERPLCDAARAYALPPFEGQ